MSTYELLWSIYSSGFVAGAIICGVARLITGVRERDTSALGAAVVVGLLGGLLWPIIVGAMLAELQAEHGIFWRREGWKPQSERILDVLRTENREMTAYEIREKDRKISDGSMYVRLSRLEQEKLIKSRRETDQEVEKYPPDDWRRKHRRRYWKITDAGRRRRVEKRSIWSADILNPFPRPV